jgi:polar amino acid transport system permease protein
VLRYNFDWNVLWVSRTELLHGLITTIELSAVIFVVAFAIGAVTGTIRGLTSGVGAKASRLYVEVFRGVPQIVVLFFFYFGFRLGIWPAVVLGLGLAMGAEISETVRSGINSIPPTQRAAAAVSGLTGVQVARYVIVPQAALVTLPVLGINALSVMKNTSIAMTLGVAELTFVTQDINDRTFHGVEAATATTIAYLVLSLLLVGATFAIERLVKVHLRTAF